MAKTRSKKNTTGLGECTLFFLQMVKLKVLYVLTNTTYIKNQKKYISLIEKDSNTPYIKNQEKYISKCSNFGLNFDFFIVLNIHFKNLENFKTFYKHFNTNIYTDVGVFNNNLNNSCYLAYTNFTNHIHFIKP